MSHETLDQAEPSATFDKTVYAVVIDHDDSPDFSWLEQDHYKPGHKDFSPLYRTEEDMKAGRNPIDPSWYTDPSNHVALCMFALNENGDILDSLGNIDFLADENDWQTGTFHHLSELRRSPYLAELAKEMGLPA